LFIGYLAVTDGTYIPVRPVTSCFTSKEDLTVHESAMMITAIAVALSILSLLDLIRQPVKRDHEVLFAVVSASLAMYLISPWMGNAPEWMKWVVAVGGSATCNGFWLVSRALFRGEGGVQLRHISLAVVVALLIAIHRGAALHTDGAPSVLSVVINAMLTLTSTSLLALSFLEPLRGWSRQWTQTERRLRLAFMAIYGGSVLSTTLLGELAHAFPALASWRSGAVALSASVMIAFTHLAFQHRRHSLAPLAGRKPVNPAKVIVNPSKDDERLLSALKSMLEVNQVFREPDLKVAELAARLGTAEHRLSKLISQQMGENNFNQLLNRHRIAYACTLLSMPADVGNILHISSECGFASLGPFNRAFKNLVGCTPSAYRARCLKEAVLVESDSCYLQLGPD
jgi:AraC-type DNA-binding domain-containing proteins